jgi:hypothetical protein
MQSSAALSPSLLMQELSFVRLKIRRLQRDLNIECCVLKVGESGLNAYILYLSLGGLPTCLFSDSIRVLQIVLLSL